MSPAPHPFSSHQSDGFVTIASVAALVVIGVVTAAFILLATYQSTVSELTWRDALQAGWLSDACGEHVIAKLRHSSTYTGGETLTFDQATCQVMDITATVSGPFQIQTQGMIGDGLSRALWDLELTAAGSGSYEVTVASHQHVIDF